MISVLLGNGMGLIWHGEELSWSEPIASAIAYVFSGINETVAISVFYFFLVGAFTNFVNVF